MTHSPAKRGKAMSNAVFARLWNAPAITTGRIADMLGVGVGAVLQRAKRRGLPSRPRGPAPKRMLPPSPKDIQFRRLYEAGISNIEIARALGLKKNTVPSIARRLGLPKRGRAWRAQITLAEYLEQQMAQRMREAAKVEQDALRLAEMRDHTATWRTAA